jgi:hypothetical protein
MKYGLPSRCGRSILGIGVGWHEEEFELMGVPNIDPVLRRIAQYADTRVPHSSATLEMVKGDWDKVQRFAYWKTSYLLGTAEEVAARMSARIANGGT